VRAPRNDRQRGNRHPLQLRGPRAARWARTRPKGDGWGSRSSAALMSPTKGVLGLITTARQASSREAHAQALKKQGLAPKLLVADKTALLRRGQNRDRLVGSTRAGLAQEQSGRDFAPACTATRAQDATLQVAGIRPVLSFNSRGRPQQFQRRAATAGLSSSQVRYAKIVFL